jgi:DNA helicase II / ATP-dependent DNA helicase PcrA
MASKKIRLNPEQKKAVDTIEGPLLIIAGAGSGKTGVVTSRIANMLNHGIPQASILALTFTNKAAREMEDRVKQITGSKCSNLTISTFHSFGVQILRRKSHYLGYRPNFSIYDQNDQLTCLKEAAREQKLTYEFQELKDMAFFVSDIKTGRKEWDSSNDQHKPLYQEFLEHMKLYNAVDFDDLITVPIQIFEQFPEVLSEYQERYRYIMVDEFQDTSLLQYHFIDLIARKYGNICCVGDDDQSIYSWRGANYQNIQQFEIDYPRLKEIKLERNYRSTGTILEAANAVIANNTNRKEKELWTEDTEHDRTIKILNPDDEKLEAEFIIDRIHELRATENITFGDVGILVRTNSLCKSMEDALLANNIPYTVSGGQSFFQRKEIKDIIAYLRVITNPDDDVNLIRIINTPRRGIGKKALQTIVDTSQHLSCSLYNAITSMVQGQNSALRANTLGDLQDFMELVETYRDHFEEGQTNLAEHLREFYESIDYWGHLVQEFAASANEKAAKYRFDNILLFADFLERWEKNPDNLEPTLVKWLNRITLTTKDEVDGDKSKVNLMTIHASKGLEFDHVFLAGVEDGIIPHARSVAESKDMVEEERRLFYVAITRARKKLFITHCQTRRAMSETVDCVPSPFLEEIPQTLLEHVEDSDYNISEEDAADRAMASMPWNS